VSERGGLESTQSFDPQEALLCSLFLFFILILFYFLFCLFYFCEQACRVGT
jgi:hypothetical protein